MSAPLTDAERAALRAVFVAYRTGLYTEWPAIRDGFAGFDRSAHRDSVMSDEDASPKAIEDVAELIYRRKIQEACERLLDERDQLAARLAQAERERDAAAARQHCSTPFLRKLVDLTWKLATDSTEVPGTPEADALIGRAMAAEAQRSLSPDEMDAKISGIRRGLVELHLDWRPAPADLDAEARAADAAWCVLRLALPDTSFRSLAIDYETWVHRGRTGKPHAVRWQPREPHPPAPPSAGSGA